MPQRLYHFIQDLQENGGKPMGMKIVIGQQKPLEDLLKAMKELNIYPDFITIDGSKVDQGQHINRWQIVWGFRLYRHYSTFIDTANHYGVRDKLKVFASGKLITPIKWRLL